jgi:hypothetical protein
MTANEFGLIWFNLATNFSFVRSVIKENTDLTGKIFLPYATTCKFYLFGCDVQAHFTSFSESGATSMSEILLSLYATRDCFAVVQFVPPSVVPLCIVSCPMLFPGHLGHSFLIFALSIHITSGS